MTVGLTEPNEKPADLADVQYGAKTTYFVLHNPTPQQLNAIADLGGGHNGWLAGTVKEMTEHELYVAISEGVGR
jgi:hypothetical protein